MQIVEMTVKIFLVSIPNHSVIRKPDALCSETSTTYLTSYRLCGRYIVTPRCEALFFQKAHKRQSNVTRQELQRTYEV